MMAASQFWLVLGIGIVMGLLLGMLLRWIGRKLLSGNQQEKESYASRGRTER